MGFVRFTLTRNGNQIWVNAHQVLSVQEVPEHTIKQTERTSPGYTLITCLALQSGFLGSSPQAIQYKIDTPAAAAVAMIEKGKRTHGSIS